MYFLILTVDLSEVNTISCRVFWEDTEFSIPFDGMPYFVIGNRELTCQHGRKRETKERNKSVIIYLLCIILICINCQMCINRIE